MSGTLHTTQYVGSGSGNSGTDSGTTIASGGAQFVGFDFGTGTATSTTIDSDGRQVVGDSGGTCRDGDQHDDQQFGRSGHRRFQWNRHSDEHDDPERRHAVRRSRRSYSR